MSKREDQFRTLEFLKSVINVIDPVEKIASYADSWSDMKVAMHLDLPGVTPAVVSGIRREVFGRMPMANGPRSYVSQRRAQELAEVVDEMRVDLDTVTKRLDRLIADLGGLAKDPS